MAAKQINFTAKNVKSFITWLKKFSSINNSLLIEVDEPSTTFLAKTYNDERSVVKLSRIKFDEAGFIVKPNKDPKRVKVGVLNISRLVKILDQFSSDDFSLTINFDEVQGETVELAGTTLLFKNKNLKISEDCTSLSIFRYISDEKFKEAISKIDDPLVEFTMNEEDIQQINSLNVLDNDNKFLEFVSKDSKYHVCGKAFEFDITDKTTQISEDCTLPIFKEQFSNVDSDDYEVKMGEDRLVFTSGDEDTVTVISMVEKDE